MNICFLREKDCDVGENKQQPIRKMNGQTNKGTQS